MMRHDTCEVRQKVHKQSTENPLADFDPFAEEEKTANTDVSSADLFVVEGRSLYCLGRESGLRHTFNDFLNHKYTGAFVLGCIILNVVILCIDTPTSNLSQSTRELFHLLDLLLSIIFSGTHRMLLRPLLGAELFANPRCGCYRCRRCCCCRRRRRCCCCCRSQLRW